VPQQHRVLHQIAAVPHGPPAGLQPPLRTGTVAPAIPLLSHQHRVGLDQQAGLLSLMPRCLTLRGFEADAKNTCGHVAQQLLLRVAGQNKTPACVSRLRRGRSSCGRKEGVQDQVCSAARIGIKFFDLAGPL